MLGHKAVVRLSWFYLLTLPFLLLGLVSADEAQIEELSKEVSPFILTRAPASVRSRSAIKRTRRTIPKVRNKISNVKKKKSSLRYIKPTSQAKLYFPKGTDESELEKATILEIQHLYKLFKRTGKANIHLRLASLYVEQGRLIEYRLYDKFSKEMQQYENKKRPTIPTMNLKPVEEYSKKAIRLLNLYLKRFPKDPRADEVLFHLGYSYFQINQPNKGKAQYELLEKRFPKSKYLEPVYFHLGEYYFDRYKWPQARSYYAKAIRFRDRFYSFSLYKMAWCLFNETRISAAIKTLEKIIKESRRSSNKSINNRLSFSKEALTDLVNFYSHSRLKPVDAYSYFNQWFPGEEKVFSAVEKLAFAYKDLGNPKAVREVFHLLIKLSPYNPKSYEYQYEVVDAYNSVSRSIFIQELSKWVKDYGPRSRWASRNQSNAKLIRESSQKINKYVRNYAYRVHSSYLQTKKVSSRDVAYKIYSLYLKAFPNSKSNEDVRFQFGDLLFDLVRYRASVDQYNIVINRYKKGKHHEAASLNRILALQKIIPSESEVRKMARKADGKSIPFPAVVKEFEQAVTQYIVRYGKRKKAFDMLLVMANIHLEYLHLDQAISYWQRVISKSPSKDVSTITDAVNTILDIYNRKKDYNNLEITARKFLKNRKIYKLPVAKSVRKVLGGIEFKKAEILSNKGEFKLSAELYEQYAKSNSQVKLSITALYNASINYEKVGDHIKVLEIYQSLIRSRGIVNNPKIRLKIMERLPVLYENQGQYLKAAYAYKQYASVYKKSRKTPDYWYNAGVIFDGMNLHKEAVKAYLSYYRSSKKNAKNQVYYLIAQIRERQGDIQRAIGNYSKYLNAPDSNQLNQIRSAHKLAILYKKIRKKSQALQWDRRTIAISKKYKKGASYAAKAQFNLTYQAYARFKSIKIPSDTSKQAKAVQKKLSSLVRLNNEVKKVISFNHIPEVVSSLALMGSANKHLAQTILAAPTPKGLEPDKLKKYQAAVKQNAAPFMKSSKDFFKQALGKSRESKSYIPGLKEIQKELNAGSSVNFKETVYPLALESL